jgi:hypothetical protein
MSLKLRPVVRLFAEAMERKLRANEHKGGWENADWNWLYSRMTDEMCELARAARVAMTKPYGHPPALDEAADVANFAMMIADVCGAFIPARTSLVVPDASDSARTDGEKKT